MDNLDNDASYIEMPERLTGDVYFFEETKAEIDQSQPDRARQYEMELVTGFAESKLIAEMMTPVNRIAVIRTQFSPDLDPSIILVGSRSGEHVFLDPGESIDMSDLGQTGKAWIGLDSSGQRLTFHADEPSPAYRMHTKLAVPPSFEDSHDDPEA